MRTVRLAMVFAALLVWGCECDPEDTSDSLVMAGIFWGSPDPVVVPVDSEFELDLNLETVAPSMDENLTAVFEVEYDPMILSPPGTTGGIEGGPSTYRVLPRSSTSVLDRFELTFPVTADLQKRTMAWRCGAEGSTTIFIKGWMKSDDITTGRLLNREERELETVDVTCGDPPPDAGVVDAGYGGDDAGNGDAGSVDGGAPVFASETIARTGDPVMGAAMPIGEIQTFGIDDNSVATFLNRSGGFSLDLVRADASGVRLAVTEAEIERVLGAFDFRNFEGLHVAKNGDVILTIVTDVTRCIVLERGGTLTKILCDGDTAPVSGSAGPVDRVTIVAANDGAQVITFNADLTTGGQPDGNLHWVHHRDGTFTTIIRFGDPRPTFEMTSALVERVGNVVIGPSDEVSFITRSTEADHDHVRFTLARGLESRIHVNVRDSVGSITIAASTVQQYPFDIAPLDAATTRAGFFGVMVSFLDGIGGGLPLSGVEVDGLTFRNLRLERNLPIVDRPIAYFNNLPQIAYQLVDDCDADDCAFVFAARVDGDETSIWRQGKSNAGAEETPVRLLSLGSDVPGLADADFESIGGMVVSDVGSVAAVAEISGPGIRSMREGDLPANHHVVVGIDAAGEKTVLFQTGETVEINGSSIPIDRVDLFEFGVGIPFSFRDFLGRHTRDKHILRGSGADGHHTVFNSNGCGQLIVRLGSSVSRSVSALKRITLPGSCR